MTFGLKTPNDLEQRSEILNLRAILNMQNLSHCQLDFTEFALILLAKNYFELNSLSFITFDRFD